MDTSISDSFSRQRTTSETDIKIDFKLNGAGNAKIDTGIAFLDHMLTLMAVHGLFDLEIKAKGDTMVDFHHTVEDVGLVLGEVFCEALGKKKGIRRYGLAIAPMDEALARVAVDISGRPFLVFKVSFSGSKVGTFDTELFEEFFRAFTNKAKITCHIEVPYGNNDHHRIEAVFKAFGRALDQATQKDPRIKGVPSSKGVL